MPEEVEDDERRDATEYFAFASASHGFGIYLKCIALSFH